MNIGILVDPYGEKSPGGLGRSIFEMAKAILAADTTDHFTVYMKNDPPQLPGFPGVHWTLRVLHTRFFWLTGGWKMDSMLDLYIFFTPVVPLFFRPKKSIVIAHDFAYLATPASSLVGRFSAYLLYRMHRRSLRLATQVVTVSQQTADDVSRYFGVDAQFIHVIPIAYIAPSARMQPLPTPPHFFLFAGVLKPRKNVAAIIEAFAEFCAHTKRDFALRIAGTTRGEYYESLVRLVHSLGITDRVVFLGYVHDEQLSYLYSKATALVFPSRIEGFGMPVLEAMSVGLPVITSHAGALAEVSGDAALLVDPEDSAAIAGAMERLAEDATLRETLRERGYARAATFSWELFATKLHTMVEQITT